MEGLEKTAFLQAKFDQLVAMAKESQDDELTWEDIYSEAHKLWRSFINAGFDIDQIVSIMSPEDIWKNYDCLRFYGAKNIDFSKMLSQYSVEFILKHKEEFAMRGVDPKQIVAECYYSCELLTFKMAEAVRFCEDPEFVFNLVSNDIDKIFNNSAFDEGGSLLDTMTTFLKLGLPNDVIIAWLDSHDLSCDVIYGITSTYREEWKAVGVNVQKYIPQFVKQNAHEVFEELSWGKRINIDATVKEILNVFSIEEIVENVNEVDNFWDFLESPCIDIEYMAKRFLETIGYEPKGEEQEFALACLATKSELIDKKKVLDVIPEEVRLQASFFWEDEDEEE